MTPQRILIARLSHLGDVVCALPLFHALRAALPEAQISWVVQSEFAGLLQELPGLDRVFLFERKGKLGAWWKLRRELGDYGADLIVDAQGNWKSAGVNYVSGAPRRLGLAKSDWRESSGARSCNEWAPPMPNGEAHSIQRTLALAEFTLTSLDIDPATITPRFDPALSPVEIARGMELADQRLPRSKTKPVVLHLATPGDVRSWPAHYYENLVRQLLARGTAVLLLSGPSEKDHGHHLRHALGSRPGLSHWINQNHLREASAFFAECARRSIPMLASDSGSMHLAAANGMRVVTLVGPQSEARTGPWPAAPDPHHPILRAEDSPDCAPCFSRRCTHPKGPVCMGNISPERVADTLTELIAQ
ncbi:MAG: heptosyltransferase-1 [Planctomycetota bacterium]|jgi:heptosyltransferase-1